MNLTLFMIYNKKSMRWNRLKEMLEELGVYFGHPELWNLKNISFWNVMHSKTSEKVMRTC